MKRKTAVNQVLIADFNNYTDLIFKGYIYGRNFYVRHENLGNSAKFWISGKSRLVVFTKIKGIRLSGLIETVDCN